MLMQPDGRPLVTPAARLIVERQEEILRRWSDRVRERVATAAQLAEPVLIDTVPALLVDIARAIDAAHPKATATETTSIAHEHGGERARLTRFGPDQVLQEYRILRDVIEGVLLEGGALDDGVRSQLQKSFDQAIQEAVLAFHLVHTALHARFVGSLSHDLRNPLAAARASAEYALAQLEQPQQDVEQVKRSLRRIVRNMRRGDRMIQSLLDSSTVQTGEPLRPNLASCDFALLAAAILEDLPQQEQARITVRAEPGQVVCDAELMRRAVENLISNAVKYGEPETPIKVQFCISRGRAIVTVHNLGAPIPLEERGLLFETLHRTAVARESGHRGWGLGLAFVRAVCEAHGGSIGVDSNYDTGTTFIIDIPAEPVPAQG